MKIKSFEFNPFSENTYVVYDETGKCIIIDPGCSSPAEEQELKAFIDSHNLEPTRLLFTHCHIDHILGCRFVSETYNLVAEAHPLEADNIRKADAYAMMFGMKAPGIPDIGRFIQEGELIDFGHTRLEILFTPGHSPGHVVFYNREAKKVIGGDVLFRNSIGRTDLPGGNFDTLINSIRNTLFTLDDDTEIYPGHGPVTKTGYEKQFNPFIKEEVS